jgi:hypothetical protein
MKPKVLLFQVPPYGDWNTGNWKKQSPFKRDYPELTTPT